VHLSRTRKLFRSGASSSQVGHLLLSLIVLALLRFRSQVWRCRYAFMLLLR
jgi:hypothetical protein